MNPKPCCEKCKGQRVIADTDGNTIPACHFCPCHPPNTEASWERELERLVYECGFFGDCRERGEKGKRDLKTFILSEKNKAREEGIAHGRVEGMIKAVNIVNEKLEATRAREINLTNNL